MAQHILIFFVCSFLFYVFMPILAFASDDNFLYEYVGNDNLLYFNMYRFKL